MTRRPLFSAALAWLAGILILASGCMDQSPTATVLEPTTVSRAAVAPTGVSAVRAAAPYQAGSVSRTITPAGGSIDFGIGTIVFPAHAVQRATVITATVDGESMAVEFGPHLVFDQAQPTLCFEGAGIDLQSVTVIHVRDDGTAYIVGHDIRGTSVCADASSFSQFVLASD